VTDWVQPDAGVTSFELDPTGVGLSKERATWEQVFGVALVPEENPRKAYVLVPRKPPKPPWFEVTPSDLPDVLRDGGLEGLAGRVRDRLRQSGYRDRGPTRPLLPPAELMERVLQRVEVPGALEVPVGAGPGGWWRRSLDLFAAGSAGGLFGLYAGALTKSLVVMLGVTAAGAVVGASVPVMVASNWRSVRHRARKPRVLVLAPDGCVVGLPSGARAFDWPSVGGFRQGMHPPPHKPTAAPRPCLEIELSDGTIAGRIDGAWFAEPLALIVSVAEAYRQRHTRV